MAVKKLEVIGCMKFRKVNNKKNPEVADCKLIVLRRAVSENGDDLSRQQLKHQEGEDGDGKNRK